MALLTKEAEEKIIGLLLAEGLADANLVSRVQTNITPDQSVLNELLAQKVISNDMVAHATALVIGVPYVELKNITIDQDI